MSGSGWRRSLAGHQILDMLPEQEARPVRNALRVLPLLHRPGWKGRAGTRTCSPSCPRSTRRPTTATQALLDREMPALLARARPLGRRAARCPGDLAAAFCRELRRLAGAGAGRTSR